MEDIRYVQKLETEKQSYMELPVSLGTMEMIREIEKTKQFLHREGHGSEESKLTRADALAWVQNMDNADGTQGAHWTMEQTSPYKDTRNVSVPDWEWYAVMNMMYSDYSKAAQKNGVCRPEFFADMAAAFLADRDAPEDKAGRYYHSISKAEE